MRIRRTKTNSTETSVEGSPTWPDVDSGPRNGTGDAPMIEADADADGETEGKDDAAPDGGSTSATMPMTVPASAEMREPWDPGKVRSTGAARAIRVLTGVTEPLLDRIPTERARYTALACVMMCTATVSGISMFFALSEVLDATSPWFLPFALFWACFILSVDRWLVSASPSKHSFARIQTLLLRLGIAVVLGFIIAEPLLLRVFQTAMVNQVIQDRRATTNDGIAKYKECNPLPGQSVPAGIDCAGWTLSLTAAASDAAQAQIDKVNADISRLTNELAAENSTLEGLATTVRDECDGVSGPGLTGRVGDGPACQADEQHYEDFKNSQPFAAQNSELSNDETKLATLSGQVTSDTTDLGDRITKAIDTWAAAQPSAKTPIGLIERFNALIQLSDDSVVVNLGAWLLRLFFVLIDCLPVLVKFIGGATPYDELSRREINTAHEVLQVEGRTRTDVAEIHRTVRLKWEHAKAAKLEQSFNAEVRDHAAAIEAKQWEAVDHDYRLRLSRLGLTPDPKEAGHEGNLHHGANADHAGPADFPAEQLPFPRSRPADDRRAEHAFDR